VDLPIPVQAKGTSHAHQGKDVMMLVALWRRLKLAVTSRTLAKMD
jgi:hypothetical protein